MRKTAVATLIAAFVVVAACGGETPTPNNTPANDASAPTPSATASVDTTPKDAGPPAIDAQHDPFVAACMQGMPSQNYCSCAWDQFREIFKDADMTQKPGDDKLGMLKQKTIAACAPKLTEAEVKPVFANACVGGDTKKTPFCDCQWTELRKKLEPPDFVTDFTGPKFEDAKKAMAKACKGKLPEAIAHADFLTGCTKAAPGKDKACECMWKKVRAKGTPEEIAADVIDTKSLSLEGCLKTP